MKTAIEVSLYPLNEDYIPVIDWFIARIDGAPGVERRTNATATQVQGEHGVVMDLLRDAVAESYQRHGKQVFLFKVFPGGVDLGLDYKVKA